MNSRVLSYFPILLGISLLQSLQASLSFFIVILGIGFLIFIHELGHFLVAKYEKVRVEAFALGFGYPLFLKKWGETEYRINLLPLGGYVKMAGEIPGEESTGAPDEFMSKKPGSRAKIVVAGVVMNFIFGFIGVILAFQIGVKFPDAVIGQVSPGGPAWHARMQPGDRIIEIDGEKITKFKQIKLGVAFGNHEKGMQFTIQRKDQTITCQVKPEYNKEMGLYLIGISPYLEKIQVSPESIFHEAGLRTSDRIVEVDGNRISEGHELYAILSSMKKQAVKVVVEREGKEIGFTLSPKTKTTYRLGIYPKDLVVKAVRTDSTAAQAGFLAEDCIMQVDKKVVHTAQSLYESLKDAKKAVLLIQNKSKEREMVLDFESMKVEPKVFLQDIYFTSSLTVGETIPDFPAAEKLMPGDKIVSINNKILEEWSDISEYIANEKDKTLSLALVRNGEKITLDLAAKKQEIPDWDSLSLLPKMSDVQSYGIVESCKLGFKDAKEMIMDIFLMLRGLFSRQIAAKNLGGPIIIFTASYSQLQMGLGYFIYFLALISINLAVINIFPFPVLDGGILFLLLIEKIRGKRISEKILIWFNNIGIALLLTLFIYVTYHDILRLIGLM
ncbi:MAG: RIP metalloprotease RseP [Candidatus Brocadiae bacterium]|nr:RIP metalloprotease RseP [Candidatus Brocadiia bacterium]